MIRDELAAHRDAVDPLSPARGVAAPTPGALRARIVALEVEVAMLRERQRDSQRAAPVVALLALALGGVIGALAVGGAP